MLLEVPLALHIAHVHQLLLKLRRVRLSALGTKRRLACRWPRERDSGREILKCMEERPAGVFDDPIRETIRHNPYVLPFAMGDAMQSLFVVGSGVSIGEVL